VEIASGAIFYSTNRRDNPKKEETRQKTQAKSIRKEREPETK
jgi:hypothetical protein